MVLNKNTNGNNSLQVVPIPLPTTVVVFCARLLLLWPAALVDQRSAGGNPWLSGGAFYGITFRLSIWFSRRKPFPDEASFGTQRACISEDPHACLVKQSLSKTGTVFRLVCRNRSSGILICPETQPVKERQANFRGLTESQEVNQAIRTSAFFDVQIRKPVKPILNLS